MRAGELRHRITLQKPSHSRDDFKEMDTSHSDVATVRAAIEWQSGRRYVEAAQVNAEVQGIIRIRYRSDVESDWRIKYGDRYIIILSIANVRERNEELVLWCKEAKD